MMQKTNFREYTKFAQDYFTIWGETYEIEKRVVLL